MGQGKSHNSVEKAARAQRIWETLTAAQREIVLQTLVQICCQIAAQKGQEESHELVADR